MRGGGFDGKSFPYGYTSHASQRYFPSAGFEQRSQGFRIASAPPVVSDYNGNGVVDVADYTVWRNGDSPDSTHAGDNLWKANLGKTFGSSAMIAVFEPSTRLLTIAALAAFGSRRHARSHLTTQLPARNHDSVQRDHYRCGLRNTGTPTDSGIGDSDKLVAVHIHTRQITEEAAQKLGLQAIPWGVVTFIRCRQRKVFWPECMLIRIRLPDPWSPIGRTVGAVLCFGFSSHVRTTGARSSWFHIVMYIYMRCYFNNR